jgi:carbamoyl-phosphate synthase large subunit
MQRIGLKIAPGGIATNLEEAMHIVERTDYPAIIRPSFTLGGTGGGIAYNRTEFEEMVRRGLDESPTRQILIERSVIGWKEFELEVMRDHDDNVVIVCSIENLDPMGVHTGTRSMWRRRDDAHRSRVSGDATRPSPLFGKSAWRQAAATFSSPSI